MRFRPISAITMGLVLASTTASAADPASKAQMLFDEARRRMDAGDYEGACPMFAESQRVDPGGGTLLNLATCHEKQGKLASAWTELNAALSLAQQDGRQDRIDLARQHIEDLAPRVPRLLVVFPHDGDASTVTVRIDGVEMGRSSWGVAFPVDPGQHRVDASAPGKRTFMTAIAVRADGATLSIEIPALESEVRQAATPPSVTAPPPMPDSGRARTPLFYIGIGTATIGYGTATVTGALAWLAHESVARKCNTSTHTCSDAQGIDDASRARTMAWVSTVALGVGIVGTAIVIFAPSWRARRAAATLASGTVGIRF